MKTLALTLVLLFTSQVYSQTVEEYIEQGLIELSHDTEYLSTWKTGDDDSYLRGVLAGFFTDSIAQYQYLANPAFLQLSVSNSTLTTIVPFTKWADGIKSYPNTYSYKYRNYDNSEAITVYNEQGKIVRTIYVYWDQSYGDGIEYDNIRYISDTAL